MTDGRIDRLSVFVCASDRFPIFSLWVRNPKREDVLFVFTQKQGCFKKLAYYDISYNG